MNKKVTGAIVATAVAALFLSGQVRAGDDAAKKEVKKADAAVEKASCKAKDKCKGKDSCKAKKEVKKADAAAEKASCKAKDKCKGKDGCKAKD